MLLEVEGFILSEQDYRESSKIVNILTKEKGLISVVCKGAKSIKSQIRAYTQKFTYALFNVSYKEGKLSTLISASLINPLKNIYTDLTKISYVSYLSELTLQVLKQTDHKNLYDMFIESILKINDGLDPVVITNILELKYLPFLGVGLDLSECALCGNKTDIVTVDASFGGLICKNCYTNEKIVSPKIIKLLRMYYYVDIKSISSLSIDDESKSIINHFISDYYDSFTGLYVYSKKFLENI